ncbi:MAG: polysaccharide pyruvyl transferase family protein, partial [Lachnospiraceae bacterium]
STCVPTLTVGYSVKSKGIARDIFGTEEHYVIPVQELQTETRLAEGFRWLLAHEEQIREHLKSSMPAYIARSIAAGEQLRAIIERE